LVIAAHAKGLAQRRELQELHELQALQQSASRWAAAAMAKERAACAMQAGYRGLVGLG
jgi:predicted ABC-class ATPase